jgi:uncharacterized membrane protein
MAERGRIVALDLARTAALASMVVFHFTFDLMLFGHVAAGTVHTGFWPWFARGIAGSFLFLAGVSLWLAHGADIRWPAFWRRFAVVAGAAALVTAATWGTMGDAYIRWGILHAIAAYSVIGLLFLRAAPILTTLTAAACIAAPFYLKADAFNAPFLLWLGLSTEVPPMVDYEPLLPWLGPLLLGIVAARLMAPLWPRLRSDPGPLIRALAWPGRHSLAVYLIHQPVLFGGIWLWTRFLSA